MVVPAQLRHFQHFSQITSYVETTFQHFSRSPLVGTLRENRQESETRLQYNLCPRGPLAGF
jgi:hypothetical protein